MNAYKLSRFSVNFPIYGVALIKTKISVVGFCECTKTSNKTFFHKLKKYHNIFAATLETVTLIVRITTRIRRPLAPATYADMGFSFVSVYVLFFFLWPVGPRRAGALWVPAESCCATALDPGTLSARGRWSPRMSEGLVGGA